MLYRLKQERAFILVYCVCVRWGSGFTKLLGFVKILVDDYLSLARDIGTLFVHTETNSTEKR